MKEIKKVFSSYLKERIGFLGVQIIFMIIFIIVFALYSLPLETILYGGLLCLFVSIILSIYDFYKYYVNYKTLLNVKHNITATLSNLPEPKALKEKSYQDLITTLYEDKVNLTSQLDKKNTELIEYFTLWTHQIKSPLAAADLLLQSTDMESKEEFKKIFFEIEEYVDMALQFLRIDSMNSDLKIEEYPLIDIVKKAVKSYATIFIYKNIKLNLKEIDVKVLTDEKWLLFVIKQILSNALKYTNSGGEISIFVEGERTLVIKDTGIGISEEDLPRVFERGFTGYNGRMNKKSTGIGLYLCKKVLDKLSHKIYITSEVGKGTAVKIDLSSTKLEIE